MQQRQLLDKKMHVTSDMRKSQRGDEQSSGTGASVLTHSQLTSQSELGPEADQRAAMAFIMSSASAWRSNLGTQNLSNPLSEPSSLSLCPGLNPEYVAHRSTERPGEAASTYVSLLGVGTLDDTYLPEMPGIE